MLFTFARIKILVVGVAYCNAYMGQAGAPDDTFIGISVMGIARRAPYMPFKAIMHILMTDYHLCEPLILRLPRELLILIEHSAVVSERRMRKRYIKATRANSSLSE